MLAFESSQLHAFKMFKHLPNEPFAFVPVHELQPFGGHARRHSDAKREKLKRSVEAFGQVMPILVDAQGTIVDGHLLYEVLVALRYEQVAVAIVSGRADEEVRALRLAVNRLSDEAEWDAAMLRREFEDLGAAGINVELTGFDVPEVELALDFTLADPTAAYSDFWEPTTSTVTQPGDMWLCDGHRIGCLDWQDASDLGRLLDGKKAATTHVHLLSDPADGDSVLGGEDAKPIGRHALDHACTVLGECTDDRGILYVTFSWRDMSHIFAAAETNGLHVIQVCVSGKSSTTAGQLYRESADFTVVLAKSLHADKVSLRAHGRKRGNLWRPRGLDEIGEGEAHAQNPARQSRTFIADLMRDSTKRRGIFLDPMLGTGATLLAAEDTGRRCFGADKNPQSIDVAVRRWQSLTGHIALRASDAKPFSECEPVPKNGGSVNV